jgi:5-methylcytosine-specific restriction enzyme subunit McrC
LRLDEAGLIRLHPDLSWWDGPVCTFVGDVKYKRVSVPGIEHSDLYQLLAYTTAAGLPGGLLVYAASEGESITHQVVHVGKQLQVQSLHLDGKPETILGEVKKLAAQIKQLRDRALNRIPTTFTGKRAAPKVIPATSPLRR